MPVRDPNRSYPRLRPVSGAPRGILTSLCLLASLTSFGAQSGSRLEFQVKAAFLYNFAKFIEWPREAFRDADAGFVICVVDDEEFAGTLEPAIKGKSVDGRAFRVRRNSSPDQADLCQILYLGTAGTSRIASYLEAVRTAPVLTVGDSLGFIRRGGVINFFIRDNRVRFEVNPDAASRAGLRISSKLLQLASVVRDGKNAEDGR
ncbi:MAG TPA: YfiR family protein [Candidatus Polarisedimenticolia bacterium]|nr:YfiR family protein [Candidatus Polarisedimenticolia bacterium]